MSKYHILTDKCWAGVANVCTRELGRRHASHSHTELGIASHSVPQGADPTPERAQQKDCPKIEGSGWAEYTYVLVIPLSVLIR